MKRVLLQPAYVLHRRAYRETSYLVDLFTPDYGRLTVIAKGINGKNAKQRGYQGLLQPFVPLLVSWSGKGDLMILSQIEANGEIKHLNGDCLFAGFYLNEILMCLLEKWDAHPGIYLAYEKAVSALQIDKLEERILRSFEKYLLEELGYGLLPKTEASLHNTFSPDKFYRFIPEQGFVVCEEKVEAVSLSKSDNLFSGKNLIAIAKEDWQEQACLSDAKRLTRFVLTPLLGTRPLYSRRLFTSNPKK